jgi:hypothetical protein
MIRHFVSVFTEKVGHDRARDFVEFAIDVGMASRRMRDQEEVRELRGSVELEAIFGEPFVTDLGRWIGTCLQHLEFAIQPKDPEGHRIFLSDRDGRQRARDAISALVEEVFESEADAS